jgi:heat shock protein HslJ
MIRKNLPAVLLSSLVFFSCSPGKKIAQDSTGTAATTLKGSQWKLVSFGNDTAVSKDNIHFKLAEDSDKMYGQGVCNTINGTYGLDTKYKMIRFRNLITTWKACNDNGTENRYFELLKEANHYKIEDGKLLLYNAQKKLAVFEETGSK